MNELIERAMGGDTEAFGDLVEREQSRVRAFVASRLSDPQRAEDLAQDTFVIAYTRRGEFDQSREFGPWLFGIARNLIMNERRKLARREAAMEELRDYALVASQESNEGDVSNLERLEECLKRVSGKMRDFVRLRYFEDCPLEEVAKKMNLTYGSARVSHVRALGTLRDCMEEKGAGGMEAMPR
jgi:RNA polymerase sigma-70 factor (ECF subfamily)